MKKRKLVLSLIVFFLNFILHSEEFNLSENNTLTSLSPQSIITRMKNKGESATFSYQEFTEKNELSEKNNDYSIGILKNKTETASVNSSFEDFVGGGIKQFGYDFFYNPPSSFIPSQTIPPTPDYVIGPGDELIISLWGRVNARWVLAVTREGYITIPNIGVINVAGIRFDEIRNFLKKEISRYYNDFEINVSMGNLKSIRVYVVGNARYPGAYTISGLSTIISALFASGGPTKNGSLRNIELKRDGRTISKLDFYDFLLKGDRKNDVKLLNDDVIFIPPVEKLVAISSGVKNPAIYELKENERLGDLIKMAGGFINTAYNKRISIKRIFNNQYFDFVEVDLSDIETNPEKNIELKDGDILSVNSVVEMNTTVNISGAVAYPGKVGIRQGITRLSDVIKLAGGVLSSASDDVEITRFTITDKGVNTTRFKVSLSSALNNDKDNNIELRPYDSILVKSISNWYLPPRYVEVGGEVESPGNYVIEKGERLYSVLKRANGFTSRAYPKGIIFIRKSVQQQQQKNLEEMILRLEKELFSQSSMGVSSSLTSEDIERSKEEFNQKKLFIENLKKVKAVGRVYIKLNSLEELKNSPYNIELMDGDKIIIPQRQDVVNVDGAVMASGSYVYKSSSYKDYIDMAGGYSNYADKSRIFILKADGSAVKAKSFLFFHTKVEPGDAVIVPQKFEAIPWLRNIRDITQILMNTALTAGTVIKVF